MKISDIPDCLGLLRPGVNQTAQDMQMKGYLRETFSQKDERITYVTIMGKGEQRLDKFGKHFKCLLPF